MGNTSSRNNNWTETTREGDYIVTYELRKETSVGHFRTLGSHTRIHKNEIHRELDPHVLIAREQEAEKARKLDEDKKFKEGNELYVDQKYGEAIMQYEQAINLTKNDGNKIVYNSMIISARGHKLYQQGKYLEALGTYKETDYVNKAACYNKLGKYSEAIKAADEALKKDPSDTNAKYWKVIALFAQGEELYNEAWEAENDEKNERSDEATEKFEKAKNNFKSAHELIPDDIKYIQKLQLVSLKIEGNTCFNEGVVLQQSGKYQEALDKYQEAIQKFEASSEQGSRFGVCLKLVQKSIKQCNDGIKAETI
jgi:tetratricopeptide (TPR) repeat protein